MPILLDGEARDGKGAGQYPQAAQARQGLANLARQGGDQIATGHNRRQTQKTRQFKLDAPADFLRFNGTVHQLVTRAGTDGDVPFALVGLQIPERWRGVQHAGVLGVGQAYPVLRIQRLLVKTGVQPGQKPQTQVGFATLQGLRQIGVDAAGRQRHVRRQRPHMGQQARQQGDVAGVGHADGEAPLAGGRVVRASALRQALQAAQHLAHGGHHQFGARCGQHALAGAYKQRVAQQPAQFGQPDADRGLALAQRLGALSHAAAEVKLVQQTQQFNVKQVQILVHGLIVCCYCDLQ